MHCYSITVTPARSLHFNVVSIILIGFTKIAQRSRIPPEEIFLADNITYCCKLALHRRRPTGSKSASDLLPVPTKFFIKTYFKNSCFFNALYRSILSGFVQVHFCTVLC